MKPFTEVGDVWGENKYSEEIQTSAVDIISWRYLRDNQMKMSKRYESPKKRPGLEAGLWMSSALAFAIKLVFCFVYLCFLPCHCSRPTPIHPSGLSLNGSFLEMPPALSQYKSGRIKSSTRLCI